MRRAGTRALSGLMILLGLVMLVVTVAAGGSGLAVGYIVGAGLVAAGSLRLYLSTR